MSTPIQEPSWITIDMLRAHQQTIVDTRGYEVKNVKAVLPAGRGLRVRVLAAVKDGGGVAVGGDGRSQRAVEFEGYIEGGHIVSVLEVGR